MSIWAIKVAFCNGVSWLLFNGERELIGETDAHLLEAKDQWERFIGPIVGVHYLQKPLTLKEAVTFMAQARLVGLPSIPDRKQLAAGERDERGMDA